MLHLTHEAKGGFMLVPTECSKELSNIHLSHLSLAEHLSSVTVLGKGLSPLSCLYFFKSITVVSPSAETWKQQWCPCTWACEPWY